MSRTHVLPDNRAVVEAPATLLNLVTVYHSDFLFICFEVCAGRNAPIPNGARCASGKAANGSRQLEDRSQEGRPGNFGVTAVVVKESGGLILELAILQPVRVIAIGSEMVCSPAP